MGSHAPLSRKPSAAFAPSRPSKETLQRHAFGDELGLESDASADSKAQVPAVPLYGMGAGSAGAAAPQGIQAKLTIGQPGDRYEQEVDRTAARVMSMPDSAVQPLVQMEAIPPGPPYKGGRRSPLRSYVQALLFSANW